MTARGKLLRSWMFVPGDRQRMIDKSLSLHVDATQRLFFARQCFLGTKDAKTPYIIVVAGSVAVGKSTTARVLEALLEYELAGNSRADATAGRLRGQNYLLERRLFRRCQGTGNNRCQGTRSVAHEGAAGVT